MATVQYYKTAKISGVITETGIKIVVLMVRDS